MSPHIVMPDGQVLDTDQVMTLMTEAARDLKGMHDTTGIDLFDRIPGALALVRAVCGGGSVRSHAQDTFSALKGDQP